MRHTLLMLPTMAAALRKVLVTGANKGIGKRIATRIPVSYTHLTLPTILRV